MNPESTILLICAIVTSGFAIASVIWHAGIVRAEGSATRALLEREIKRIDCDVSDLKADIKHVNRNLGWIMGKMSIDMAADTHGQ